VPLLTSEISQSVQSSFGGQLFKLFAQSYADTDPIIHVCFLIITISFSATLIITILLFTHRVWSQYLQNRKNKLKEKYSLLLTGIIFDDLDETFDTKRKKLVSYFRSNYLKTRYNKRILRKELLALHRSFSGPSQEVLKGLYLELNLHKEALRQLSDTDWSEKADAVRELSQLQIMGAEKRIIKLTSHENKVLRLEAQAAMLALNDENPFGFLATAKGQMSEWQQLNLEERAKRLELKKIPNFAQWFGLENQSVVQFCIKMTAAYNQFESTDALLGLLNSNDEGVVKETVKAIGTMMISEGVTELVGKYTMVAPDVQDEIISSLGKIGGEEAVVFLESILREGTYEMALKAGKSLYALGPESESVLSNVLAEGTPIMQAIVNHVMDERI
jgi:hypothetical protein